MDIETQFGSVTFNRVPSQHQDEYWTQMELNDNWYVVHFVKPTDSLHPVRDYVFVAVWATPDGTKEAISNPIDLKGSTYNRVAHRRVRKFEFDELPTSFTEFLTEVLNTAVCTVEEKRDEEEAFLMDVTASLEAIKETHHEDSIERELDAERKN